MSYRGRPLPPIEKWPIMRSTPREPDITLSGVTGTNQPHGQHDPYSQQGPSNSWYTQPTPPAPPPAPKKSMSTGAILGIVFGAIAVLCIGAAVLGAFLPDQKKPAAVQDNAAGTPAASGQPATTAAASTAPPAAAGPLTSFGDGTHEVGSGPGQIPPGTYTAVVPDQAFDLCVWSRLRGFSGEGKDVIAVGTGNKGDKQRVTITPTDKGFDTKGCGTWTKA